MEDRGVKRILSRTLLTLEVTNGTWPGFTNSEVRAAPTNLNASRAAGPNKINLRLLRHLGPKVVPFKRQLFRKFCESTSFEQGWREADIRHVAKRGMDPQKPDSYRPISIISTIGKLMERLVTNRIRYEAETRRLLSENQADFRNGRSTEDQLLRLSNQSATASNAAQ